MASPRTGFIRDVQTTITQVLQHADAWSALQQEYATFTTNSVTITDVDVQAIMPNLTAAQFNQAMAAMTEATDYIHVATRAAKLYRVKA